MPEFRQDIITGNWVIVAKERARRPEDFSKPEKPHKEHYRENCPFCVGNEGQTPPEVYAVRRDGSQPDQPGWKVRAVPNKFPALTSNGQVSTGDVGIYRTMSGVGAHEVILETPDHDRSPAELTQQELEDVIATYRHRYRALLEDDRIKYVSIFRNHGRSAGASLEHPHSQVIATPIDPPQYRGCSPSGPQKPSRAHALRSLHQQNMEQAHQTLLSCCALGNSSPYLWIRWG
jgi:UDPglucose--hexose-1-phosphate uridylyltransferase